MDDKNQRRFGLFFLGPLARLALSGPSLSAVALGVPAVLTCKCHDAITAHWV